MNRYLILILFCFCLSSCYAKDERYYQLHPQKLQQALQDCTSQSASCDDLKKINDRMQQLAYELQLDPQNFGQKIIQMQQKIAQQEHDLRLYPKNKELHQTLEQNKQDLAYLLAVIKWLESPGG